MQPLDHGVLNLPLAKRHDIDAELDAYKAQQAREAAVARKAAAATTKELRAAAKAAVARARKIQLLRAARTRIQASQTMFVCNAIAGAAGRLDGEPDEVIELCEWIYRLLDGAQTLEGWLEEKHGISDAVTYYDANGQRRMRITRLAWIDWMIAELDRAALNRANTGDQQ